VKDLNQEGELMIQQAILPFKMERTDELITPRSGLGLFAEDFPGHPPLVTNKGD
jgi:hypothetical protein